MYIAAGLAVGVGGCREEATQRVWVGEEVGNSWTPEVDSEDGMKDFGEVQPFEGLGGMTDLRWRGKC